MFITDKAADETVAGVDRNLRLETGGTDWVRTSGLALMKRPLYR